MLKIKTSNRKKKNKVQGNGCTYTVYFLNTER